MSKPTAPPTPATAVAPPPPPAPTAPPPTQDRTRKPKISDKSFSIEPWTGAGEGEKITLYASSGLGKTTLAATAPRPVFIGFDDGGRKIRHPKTGKPVDYIPGVETVEDVRAVCNNVDLFKKHDSLVIDTFGPEFEARLEQNMLATVPKTSKGVESFVHNIKDYGWNDGFDYLLDQLRLILQDLDNLVRNGKNVILICQETSNRIDNTEGMDYRKAGPHLRHTNSASNVLELMAWSDHVLRIGFHDTFVHTQDANARVGKAIGDNHARVIYAGNRRSFFAKSRTLKDELITFASPEDDSLWQFMFAKETK